MKTVHTALHSAANEAREGACEEGARVELRAARESGSAARLEPPRSI